LYADETDELLILYIVVAMVTLSYMFVGNYVGQKVMDYNNDIFFTLIKYLYVIMLLIMIKFVFIDIIFIYIIDGIFFLYSYY